VVLIYLAVNIATIRAFRTQFRDQFRLCRHLLLPAAATVLFLFPLWGILHPNAYTLVNLLPFAALGMAMPRRDRCRRPAGKTARTPRGTRQEDSLQPATGQPTPQMRARPQLAAPSPAGHSP
jgi:hypothetical protein